MPLSAPKSVPPPHSGFGQRIGAIAVLLLAAGVAGGGLWVGLLWMVNPAAVEGWADWLPRRQALPTNHPALTLDAWQAKIRATGRMAGQPLRLDQAELPAGTTTQWDDVVIPVFRQQPCPTGSVATIPADPQISVSASSAVTLNSGQGGSANSCPNLNGLQVLRPAARMMTSAHPHGQQQSQPDGDHRNSYYLVAELTVPNLEAAIAVADDEKNPPPAPTSKPAQSAQPGGGSTAKPSPANRFLPLTSVQLVKSPPTLPGYWLNAVGQVQRSAGRLAYGYMVYYNPDQIHLSLMTTWRNPTGKLPNWQEVSDADGTDRQGSANLPELVINQTNGMEPRFTLYRLEPMRFRLVPFRLEEVTLLPVGSLGAAYQNALILAQGNLWSPALQQLQPLQRQRGWTADLQAQVDLIRLHAQVTARQANQAWTDANQQVLAALLDGRWDQALDSFASHPRDRADIANLLKSDRGRIWQRVTAALRVNPKDADARAWGALVLMAQQNRSKTLAWLNQQPSLGTAQQQQVERLLNDLEIALNPGLDQVAQLVGNVQPLKQVTPSQWLTPEADLDLNLPDGLRWYQVEVMGLSDGRDWRSLPDPTWQASFSQPTGRGGRSASPIPLGQAVWQRLGFDHSNQLAFMTLRSDYQPQLQSVAVKAVRLAQGRLWLLVEGGELSDTASTANPVTAATTDMEAISSPRPPRPLPALGLTETALNQLAQPDRLTLADLAQPGAPNSLNPQGQKLLQTLWRELQTAGYVSNAPAPNRSQLQTELADLPLELHRLTGAKQPDILITIDAPTLARLQQMDTSPQDQLGYGTPLPTFSTYPRRLILSAKGRVLYSEFGTAKPFLLVAIANLSRRYTPTLILTDGKRYRLQQWSSQQQRFQ